MTTMTMTEFLDRDIADQGAALRGGQLRAIDLIEATLARIGQRNPALNAFVHVDADGARHAARLVDDALQRGEDPGPLAGIPIAVKDLIDVRGMPGWCGSKALDPVPATGDARIVARLRRAGAIIIGKVATYEFALTGPAWDQPYPPARNPWNPAHITGGSSSGSAAAVAGGMVRVAIGTDTGGSIRSPASYCGIVGLKPTAGLVPTGGIHPLSVTLDHAGPLAASAAEAAMLLGALAGNDAPSRPGQPVRGMRLGFARDWLAGAQPAIVAALDDAASQFSLAGASISVIEMPDYDLFEAAGCVILQAEALSEHLDRLASRYDRYGVDARRNLLTGAVLQPEDLAAAHRLAARLARDVDDALGGCDAIITATTLQTAPAFDDFGDGAAWTPMRTLPFNVTGHPAISLPCGFAAGLPIGLQIIARRGQDAMLCRIAGAFEGLTAHSLIRPPR